MNAVLILIFLLLGLSASAFAIWPVLSRSTDSRAQRATLAAVTALFVLGIGGGLYAIVGSPGLALRSLTGPRMNDLPGLVATLVDRVRAHPDDTQAWALLGRGYLTLGAAQEAAGAFGRAAALAPLAEKPALLSSYGEALTFANQGVVPDEAVAAFQAALRLDPKTPSARFYMGLAFANRRQNGKAAQIWQQLLDEAPPDAPYRTMLTDRLASLKSAEMAGGQVQAPNIAAMVARLAASLKAAPDNPAGWARLVRAYAVLGQKDKAAAALADARNALKSDPAALAGVEAEAKTLKIQP